MNLVIVSGLSGSGKSSAIKVLEDLGYYCVDNLPPQLINTFLNLCKKSSTSIEKAAFGIDIREGEFLENIHNEVKKLKKSGRKVESIFLDAADQTLIKRYKESRRVHPLAPTGNLPEGIRKERDALQKIRDSSDHVIDTSKLSVHQLKQIIIDIFGKSKKQKLMLNFSSFGYKHGIPNDPDIMIDVRFLPNPHFNEKIKKFSGLDAKIKRFVLKGEQSRIFLDKLVDFLDFLFDKYILEGKSYLTVAIGCTGGKHRSVVVVEELGKKFKKLNPNISHRDINKE
ncbi:MAG: RNase adapter RapZ [Candidatus Dadabacteria bacterium]|nr:RNase adapter RapZ [Candidatus Dadabacteria bacterium]NIS10150.1 RNase adapter RapZ [Candidatus Dadabacteria bacterium]NIV42501.1 RNase adapter RapZ [Candidatus Dadabacteria bacterium]NIX16544.1 RNase adapter RapZ [Candidatus Dadabacteria bacterium]NIY23064.1 RNase adapter RapZ [Candidatus Dadabacteria bacterium]